MLRLVATDEAVGEVVNVGNDHEVTIEGLAHMVKEQTEQFFADRVYSLRPGL